MINESPRKIDQEIIDNRSMTTENSARISA